MKAPDYSSFAMQYAQSRPGYPEGLFKYLASLVEKRGIAWDCATGSGQAALSLANFFDKVVATDISHAQVKNAFRHPGIHYLVCLSERTCIGNNSVDLITAASAVHWFNLPAFYKEAERIMKPGGILAVWTYHVGYVEPPLDKLFLRFYTNIISPFFAEGARLVDNRYEDINLPGTQIESEEFFVSADWNVYNLLNFIQSWSGTQQYIKEVGQNPVDLLYEELIKLWGDPKNIHTIHWPLFIKISRL